MSNGWGILRNFVQTVFTPTEVEDTPEAYQKLGLKHKLNLEWKEAADCFRKAGDLNLASGCVNSASKDFDDAASCYEKFDLNEAILYYNKAIELHLQKGNSVLAAYRHEKIAEILHTKGDFETAHTHYDQAGELYGEGEKGKRSSALVKAADCSALLASYTAAVSLYERSLSGCASMQTSHEILLKEIICNLLKGDEEEELNILNRCANSHPSFQGSERFNFLKELISCVKSNDVCKFSVIVKWKINLSSNSNSDTGHNWYEIMFGRLLDKIVGQGIFKPVTEAERMKAEALYRRGSQGVAWTPGSMM